MSIDSVVERRIKFGQIAGYPGDCLNMGDRETFFRVLLRYRQPKIAPLWFPRMVAA